jgi:hypothetical protein
MNRVGVGLADITPPAGIELAGYGRDAPSTGVLDRLSAISLHVSDGERAVSITAIDLAGLDVAMATAVRTEIAARLGLERAAVMLCATHTHSGPFFVPRDPLTAAYLDDLHERLVEVATRAAADPVPCTVSSGVTEAAIGVNRRSPEGAVDRRIGTLAFEAGGEPLAMLVVATAHANALLDRLDLVSADFPGAARRRLGCPAAVVIGAAGDVNAAWRGTAADMARNGEAVAEAVLRAPRPPGGHARVSAAARVIHARLVEPPDEAGAARLAREVERERGRDPRPWLEAIERGVPPALPLELAAVRIGEFVLCGVPAEPFSALALDLAARTGSQTVFLCGTTNGYLGYLPTAAEHARGGYEVDWSPVVYGPDTGLIMPFVPETAGAVVDALSELVPR